MGSGGQGETLKVHSELVWISFLLLGPDFLLIWHSIEVVDHSVPDPRDRGSLEELRTLDTSDVWCSASLRTRLVWRSRDLEKTFLAVVCDQRLLIHLPSWSTQRRMRPSLSVSCSLETIQSVPPYCLLSWCIFVVCLLDTLKLYV